MDILGPLAALRIPEAEASTRLRMGDRCPPVVYAGFTPDDDQFVITADHREALVSLCGPEGTGRPVQAQIDRFFAFWGRREPADKFPLQRGWLWRING